MDKVGKFGANLGAIDTVFFEELVMDNVPSAKAVTATLAATTLGHQLAEAADEAATWMTLWFGIMVPPLLMPGLARGHVSTRALWALAQYMVDHPSLLAACGPFMDWCRVTVAMAVNKDNLLRSISGLPQPVAHNDTLGWAWVAVCNLDFPHPQDQHLQWHQLWRQWCSGQLWMPWWPFAMPVESGMQPRKTCQSAGKGGTVYHLGVGYWFLVVHLPSPGRCWAPRNLGPVG
jgi:hypothetical protein